MRYILVRWIHSNPGYPVEMYSEIDDCGSEMRKVEVFADGTIGFADLTEATHSTALGEKPLPPVEEIATDPQFQPVLISKEEFEQVWAQRRSPAA